MPIGGALNNVIHGGMSGKLDDFFFTAAVTIQENTQTNTSGVLTDSWAAVSTALTGLACAIAPTSPTDERRLTEPYLTATRETHVIIIAGYYNAITTAMRAVVTTPQAESLTLDILAVEHDSQNRLTRLRAEVVGH